MSDNITLRPIDLARDAEKLAAMWNDSDAEWPGTWTGGVPTTAQYIRDWHEQLEYLAVHVWDAGDRIAGYCSLIHGEDEDDLIYLPLLNVSPHFQGKSLGRKVLVNAIEKTIEEKRYRLDLDTWSGNFKAMAAYKRTGFFWDTGPWPLLRNFIPAILQMPCARYFFDKHDWYQTFQRDLSHVPDEEQWEGMNVFTYRFESDNEQLTVWADREARRITAVDTADLFVAATVDDLELIRGQATTMRWKITNKKDTPATLSLIAKETGDLSIDYREERTVEPGESITLGAPVNISQTAGASEKGKPAPRINTQIRWNDIPIDLGTGIRPQVEITMSIHPEEITVSPGAPKTVDIQLRSSLPDDVEAEIRLAPSEGLKAAETQHTVTLPAKGYAGLSAVLTAERAGLFDLTISTRTVWNGKTVEGQSDTHTVFALPPGGLLHQQKDKSIRVENETFRAVLNAKAGSLAIKDTVTGKSLAEEGARPMPPWWPSEYQRADFTLSAERDGSGLMLTASYAAKKKPGMTFRRNIRINAGAVITFDHVVENTGFEPQIFRLYHYVMQQDAQGGTLTLPLRSGLFQGRCSDQPAPSDYDFKRGDVYAESWGAYAMTQGTIGVLWPDDGEEVEWGSAEFEKRTAEMTCAPQTSVAFEPLHVYVGDGGWQTVRRLWQRANGMEIVPEMPPPEPIRELTPTIEPAVPVVVGDKTQMTVRLNPFRTRPTAGTLHFDVPDDWHCEPSSLSFSEINWQQPFSAEVTLTTDTAPGAYFGWMVVEGAERDTMTDFPLIRLGDGSEVAISETEAEGHAVHTIHNGLYEIDVIPSFLGIVSAMRDAQGVNHLATAFPEPSALNASYPWYGGVQPCIKAGSGPERPGLLAQETFSIETVTHRDGQGIAWTGFRQRAALTHEAVRGMTLELDTLTVGGSPVIKQVWRFINHTSVARRLHAGWEVFVQPDGDRGETLLFSEDFERKHSDRTGNHLAGHWGAAANPDTGRTVALISSRREIRLDEWGPAGGHMGLNSEQVVPADGMSEMIAYVAVTDDREDIRWLAALKDLQ